MTEVQETKNLVLDTLDTKLLTEIGKAHYLILSLLEAAARDIKEFPHAVGKNAVAMNQEALAAIATHLEGKEGPKARDKFLNAVTSIFKAKKSKAREAVKPKAKAKK